ncbi:dihydroneopterin aldolase [Prevotella sp. E2-28]|uniref:dihydroneopterin aldolase n=1 Tax=Prevotella sp. E2-28 TaxID=2913620 RepID=UPI001EDACA22|nr:dihydroneopterin aldolase [Prevotella sp. E2-28]UKK54248.1 dihydroneopterin aldolase [Prevotella sp. E2-28]
MTLTESSICLNDIRLYAFHGVLEQERRVGGEYSVSIRVHYNIYKAMETDNVADTLNYAQLLKIVKREMAVPSNLLEHVAGRIGKTVFHEFPQAEAIDLTVTKLNPPMGADCAGASVHVHLINDKTLQ